MANGILTFSNIKIGIAVKWGNVDAARYQLSQKNYN